MRLAEKSQHSRLQARPITPPCFWRGRVAKAKSLQDPAETDLCAASRPADQDMSQAETSSTSAASGTLHGFFSSSGESELVCRPARTPN